eukprot:894018-Pyramimonas_sp.AAC.1
MQRGARGGGLFLHMLAICNISSSPSLPTAAKPLDISCRPRRLAYPRIIRIIISPALPSPVYTGQTALHITLFTFTKYLKGDGNAQSGLTASPVRNIPA